MQSKLVDWREGRRAFEVRLEAGEEIVTGLARFARSVMLGPARIVEGEGAVKGNRMEAESAPEPEEELTLLFLQGRLIPEEGKVRIRLRLMGSRAGGGVVGGYLEEGFVKDAVRIHVREDGEPERKEAP